MNADTHPDGGNPRNNVTAPMRPRNGSVLALAGFLFYEANELYLSLRARRTAAWVTGGPVDASDWPFVIRTPAGPAARRYEGLEVCTGAALAARHAWARYSGEDYFHPHVWVLVRHRLCPVSVLWEVPGLAPDGSITCEGTVEVGDTQIGRLSYVIAGADA